MVKSKDIEFTKITVNSESRELNERWTMEATEEHEELPLTDEQFQAIEEKIIERVEEWKKKFNVTDATEFSTELLQSLTDYIRNASADAPASVVSE